LPATAVIGPHGVPRPGFAQPAALTVPPLMVVATCAVAASLSAGLIVLSGEWHGRVTTSYAELPNWALAGLRVAPRRRG
jgi:hypothetical protein